ncbi:MAG: hypothetical protein JW722_07350 [Demequinaceae bacterium]|nr:hypothetical protein [Demequinaceae bacterium]
MEHSGDVVTVEVPPFVLSVLSRSAEDVQWIEGMLRSAEDLEWVSDAAALFLTRLDHVRRLMHTVGTRLDSADTAIRALSR